MGSGFILGPVIFLIDVLFGMYILLVMMRFLLQTVRGDFYNPITQVIVKLTNPPLKPLRRIIPGWGGLDNASLVLLVTLQTVSLLLIGLLAGSFNDGLSVPGLVMAVTTKLVSLTLYVYLISIIIIVILSWVSPGTHNPLAAMLNSIIAPIIRPLRKLIPPFGGMDFSPLVATLFLYILIGWGVRALVILTINLGFPREIMFSMLY